MDGKIEKLRIESFRGRSTHQNATQRLKVPGGISQHSLNVKFSDEVEHRDLQHGKGVLRERFF